ncbi:rhodanese-like domain-containing protein (plasmid) [Halorussus limi]|uniref:Rhodanese-like domain-containing protein n=1 Tax=Halorussus limi TaxID=2938695 RepID=A0A8U0I1D9_9EURY|nr:rhodanese-like domain-containing protein [Halorussus limi]UPV76853.1 rhodanese-like domain-containing protein [Halorussus limi]
MDSKSTTRRRYLLTAGTAATALLAGCQSGADSGDGTTTAADGTTTANATTTDGGETTTAGEETTESAEDYPTDQTPDDGYPPEFDDRPSATEFDADSFPTVSEEAESGSTVEVPLVPLDVAYNLYARREARMVDARAKYGYEVSHVLGAVRSPPPKGGSDDPTDDWPDSDRVITYCHCPTHLAVERAANLIDDGFEEVYALQNGFQAWKVADYPTAGSGVPATAKTWTVEGTTDSGDAGGVAYVYDSRTDRVAGAEIAADGSYAVEFASGSVSGSDTVTVGTPSYEVEGKLSSFAETTVTADAGTTNGTAGNTTTAPNGTTTMNGTTVNGTATENGTTTTTESMINLDETTTTNRTTTTTNRTTTANGTDDSSDTDSLLGRLVGGQFW